MRLLKYDRVITECSECIYNFILPFDKGNVCDAQSDDRGNARRIEDAPNIPDWCPLEEV